MLSLIRSKTAKKRTILFGLKADNCSREILLQLLSLAVKPGDYVLAVLSMFSTQIILFLTQTLSTFMKIYVDLQVKVCEGDSYISELTHQVRANYATILVLGCSLSRPKNSVVYYCLKGLPPTCTLLVMDTRGRILLQRQGTSQQGSPIIVSQSQSPPSKPSSSSSPSQSSSPKSVPSLIKKMDQIPEFSTRAFFNLTSLLETKQPVRHFTPQDLSSATKNFDPEMEIGEGGNSKVYQAKLDDGQTVAVKVLSRQLSSDEDLVREVQMLCGLKHENIVEIVGFCSCKEMQGIVYNILKGSLKNKLRELRWSERMGVAIGVAKALKHLHHSCSPPIVHRDVKSSNILLSDNSQPQLSDFGAAIELSQSQPAQENSKPYNVVGTFGYLAPEFMMYGKITEKIDVYSFGVVLLELISGKEAIQSGQTNCESLVLWARSLHGIGLGDSLIDPNLKGKYNKEEMEMMMIAARLCLVYSSSSRPTMETILRMFEEPEFSLKMHKARDELLNPECDQQQSKAERHRKCLSFELQFLKQQ